MVLLRLYNVNFVLHGLIVNFAPSWGRVCKPRDQKYIINSRSILDTRSIILNYYNASSRNFFFLNFILALHPDILKYRLSRRILPDYIIIKSGNETIPIHLFPTYLSSDTSVKQVND